MTTARYHAYCRIRREFELLTSEALTDDEKALLRDVAEGLLLADADAHEQIEELRTKGAVALSLLVGLGRWSDAAADAMWERLVACGPLDSGAPRRARAVQHV